MTAADRLRALAATDTGSYGEMYALRKAAEEIADLIQAAERAEQKLWHEYRKVPGSSPLSDHESWAEGESLHGALAAVKAKLTETA